jgi:Sec-independent protein translocase protein TatA
MGRHSRRAFRDAMRFWKIAILVCVLAALAIFGVKKVGDTMRQDAASVGELRPMGLPGAERPAPVPGR